MELGKFKEARDAYKANLKRHAGRLNSLYGAGLASQKLEDFEEARKYFEAVITTARLSNSDRPGLAEVKSFLKVKV
jgi:hypothetical protein